jgi:uncharacterized protein YkwD
VEPAVKRVVAVAAAVTVALLTGAATCEPGATVLDGDTLEGSNMISLINQRRAAVPCPPVARDQKLTDAANRHVVDMRDHNIRDHTGSDGSTAPRRIADAGFAPVSATGEIIYWSDQASDYKAAVAWWMNSPGHRAIIENCKYTHIGVGVLYPNGSRYFAVADFGAH